MKICKNCNIEYESGNFCKKCGSVLIDKDEQSLVCANCGNKLEPVVKFCPECGTKVAPQKLLCSGCGMELKPGVKFCPECGMKVGEEKKEKSSERGKQLFLQANDCEDYDESFKLYQKGLGVSADQKLAFQMMQKSANSGFVLAQYLLGSFYEKGWGTIPEFYLAFTYYKKAAEQGYCNAQYNLGRCYKDGIGTDSNMKEAKRWLKLAMDNGSEEAAQLLNSF